jgi:hypothetical protein
VRAVDSGEERWVLDADAVVVAITGTAARTLLADVAPQAAALLAGSRTRPWLL